MTVTTRTELTAMIRAERAALAEDLDGLSPAQWAAPSLCGRWSVEEVVAHLTAAASVRFWAWLRSMVAARFDDGVHNDRRLAEHRGAAPTETLERFRGVVDGPAGPTGHTAAWLGEVVVHGDDIRRPLGLPRTPSIEATTAVAEFFSSRDFTVNGRTAIAGLRLEATDGPFATGPFSPDAGPLVTGSTLALVMAMAGRPAALTDLEGDGVAVLRDRIS